MKLKNSRYKLYIAYISLAFVVHLLQLLNHPPLRSEERQNRLRVEQLSSLSAFNFVELAANLQVRREAELRETALTILLQQLQQTLFTTLNSARHGSKRYINDMSLAYKTKSQAVVRWSQSTKLTYAEPG